MLKKQFALLLLLLLSFGVIYSQNSSYYFGFSLLRSDIHGSVTEREVEQALRDKSNSPKTGYSISIGRASKIWKSIDIDISFNYQERWPIEKFSFLTPILQGGTDVKTLSSVPTSPQSELWDSNKYLRLSNFKYGHLEVIPLYSFGDKLECSLGVGVFYGRLLNHTKLKFTTEDFPAFDFVFGLPPEEYIPVSYRKLDIGWIPKINIGYKISPQIKLGFSAKGYISEYALPNNNTYHTNWGRQNTTTWKAITLGINLIYAPN